MDDARHAGCGAVAQEANAVGAGPAAASGPTSTVRSFTRTAGTGNTASRNHRYAVWG
ncbi:hypothetical protein [Mycobacterium sp.]|uniref:hypothetical protein n=1 Tax=Mycobacterium sp. TaxID=1785 RepID=UPI0025FA80B7|nr:hypothetical protein [Mycobacterium sp.]